MIVGSSFGTQSVTINKTGVDGTYYEVRTDGSATSTVSGRYNAFAMDAPGSKTTTVGLNASTATAGLKSGTVTVDNLDITTAAARARAPMTRTTLSASTARCSITRCRRFRPQRQSNSLALDFGTIAQNSGQHALALDIFDLVQTAGYTAKLDLDSIAFSGNSSVFSSTLAPFSNLDAGSEDLFSVYCDTTSLGTFSGTYSLTCSDENIPGAADLFTDDGHAQGNDRGGARTRHARAVAGRRGECLGTVPNDRKQKGGN